MKEHLEQLMKQYGVDALFITGPAQHNPAMVYFTGIIHVTQAELVKKRGATPILFHGPMERDEAAKTGFLTRSYSDYPYTAFLKLAKDDRVLASALRYKKMLEDCDLKKGKVALYGQMDLGSSYEIFNALQKAMPEITFCGIVPDEILMQAMMTKDTVELERIGKMAEITVNVVNRTAELLKKSKVSKDHLRTSSGEALTIGMVKAKINYWLAELGAENPEGTIFSMGHDAGIPHSTGNDDEVLRLGTPIIFDIFPCEAGGGYYYDFTRTWCLGFAPKEVQKLYEDVLSVYNTVVGELEINKRFLHYQNRACELFEGLGHPTIASDMTTELGYVHSLGHGVGLHIHEKPFSGVTASPNDTLGPGSVFTIEPGLYYPDKGLGVRIEDTYYGTADGKFKSFVEFPIDLVIPVQ
jgi:Xaa-Pro aminopeptidase